jgi:chorismate mutase
MTKNGHAALQRQREAIDLLDAELVRLLNHRAQIASELASIKQSSGLPVYDQRREQQILERICRQNQGPLDSPALTSIFRCILRQSRRIQASSMQQSSTNFVQQENSNGDQYGSKRIRS